MATIQILATLKKKNIQIWTEGGELRLRGPRGAITEEIRAEIAAHKGELLALLGDGAHGATVIERARRRNDLPLSFGQQRLWFLDSLDPNSAAYNISVAMHLQGPLNVAAMQASLDDLVARHESLRTTFVAAREGPIQVVAARLKVPLPIATLTGQGSAEEVRRRAKVLLQQEARRPFDLSQGPLIRALLVRLEAEAHILLLTLHHIITDGWSTGVLNRELSVLYRAHVHETPVDLPALPIQYADYALWQRQWIQEKVLAEQLGYWRKQLGAGLSVLELPTDRPRQRQQTLRGATCERRLTSELVTKLDELSRREGTTRFMTMLAAFQTLLFRYTGQTDIAVGTPIANRGRSELEGLIGFFVNTLVLRTDLSGGPSFRELLERVRKVALDAYAHQDLPFEKLVEELRPERELNRTPLFQVMFVLQNAPSGDLDFAGLRVRTESIDTDTAKFDLTLYGLDENDGLRLVLEYNTDLYERSTGERLLGHMERLMGSAVANPEACIGRLPLLAEGEQHQIVVEWNRTERQVHGPGCVHEWIEAQFERTPDAVAIVCDEQAWTYRQLNTQANHVAQYLIERGVGAEQRVGVSLRRRPEMIAVLLGILKAGGAYVPLDPSYPEERLRYMLEDGGIAWLVTEGEWVQRWTSANMQSVNIDQVLAAGTGKSADNVGLRTKPENLAYVLYTSGSTGRPKGVAIEHRSAARFVEWAQRMYSADEWQGVLASTSISFDLSVFEIFGTLSNGGCVLLVENALQLASSGVRDRVTLINTVPSAMTELVRQGAIPKSVRTVNLAGETVTQELVESIYGLGWVNKVYDLYGPTEDTTYSTCALRGVGVAATIGRPLDNEQAYILDALGQVVPIGVAGELYLGGAGLARGYLNRPELTAEKFLPNPFGPQGSRLYRTGDLARYRADGQIEYLGRIDQQVKVRGFRIELGEIATVLRNMDGVRDAVVICDETAGDKRLLGYVVPEDGGAVRIAEWRNALRAHLPEYMVPGAIVPLAALPLTPNGKLDRRALPVPSRMDSEADDRAEGPTDYFELQLAQLWEKVLGVHPVRGTDNFFHLGGHSLLAARLLSEIEKIYGRKLAVRTLFEAPTVQSLAGVLREKGFQPIWTSVVPIQTHGTRPPLFCMPPTNAALGFYPLAHYLGSDQPLYAVLATPDGTSNPFVTVEEEAAYYVQEIRRVQPHGPYWLIGWSYGGIVSLEVAQQIYAQGEQVALLGILDTGFNFTDARARIEYLQRRFRYLTHLTPGEMWERLWHRADMVVHGVPETKNHLEVLPKQGIKLPAPDNNPEADQLRMYNYRPYPYPGRVTLFRTPDRSPHRCRDPYYGWRRLARGGVDLYEITGDHEVILHEPHVQKTAEQLDLCLRRLMHIDDVKHKALHGETAEPQRSEPDGSGFRVADLGSTGDAQ